MYIINDFYFEGAQYDSPPPPPSPPYLKVGIRDFKAKSGVGLKGYTRRGMPKQPSGLRNCAKIWIGIPRWIKIIIIILYSNTYAYKHDEPFKGTLYSCYEVTVGFGTYLFKFMYRNVSDW